MAYTVVTKKHVAGDLRMHTIDVNADSASEAIPTGLSYVEAFTLGCVSAATNGFSVKPNATTASAVANGSVLVASAAAGDRFYLTVWGRG